MELTRDTLLGGQLVLWQPAKGHGYRFNLDPVFLASFTKPSECLMDLGAGCGVLSLFLLRAGLAQRVVAVEREPEMADLITRNALENGLGDRVQVVCGDLRHVELPRVDGVVFNPPYFRANQGRPAKNKLRDSARFERHGTLMDFVDASVRVVGDGEVAGIVPVERRDELLGAFIQKGMKPTRQRDVATRPGESALLSMVAAANQGPEKPVIESELVIHESGEGRVFSPEVKALVEGA